MRALITEAELKKLPDARAVLVPRGAIVTPAARDYARERGVALLAADGSEPQAHPGTGAASVPGVPVEDAIIRIARAALARLGPGADLSVLVRVVREALVRLGYAVAIVKGGEPEWPWKHSA